MLARANPNPKSNRNICAGRTHENSPHPDQNLYSSDETDDETAMSQTDKTSLDGELSQLLTSQTAFQKAFARPTEKNKPEPCIT